MGRHKKPAADEPTPKELKKAEAQAKKLAKKWEQDLFEIRQGLFVHDSEDDDGY